MKKTALLFSLAVLLSGQAVFGQQTHVNRDHEDNFGQPKFNPLLTPFGVQYSRSIECANGDRLTVAHTFVSGQGENILLERRSGTGTQIWATDVNTNSSDNDYGIAVYEDPNTGDIYVCGTTDQGGPPASYEAVVIIFDAGGNLTTSVTIGNGGQNYIATALTIHPASGNLLVGMTAEGASTGYDYRLEELNPTSLSGINSNTYDKNNLIEVLLGIEIDTGTGDIILLGASQNSSGTWSYAAAVFDGSSLNYISDTRTNLGGFDDDQPLDFAKDASNNIYLTGKTWNGTDFDIKTIKLAAPSYSIAWTSTLDVHGMDDVAGTVDVDPVTGEVVIGGFATRSNGTKDMLIAKHNGSTGSLTWQMTRIGKDPSSDASIRKICINQSNSKIYFTAGEKGASGVKRVVSGRVRSNNGTFMWSRTVENGTNDVLPSDIQTTNNGFCIISVLDSVLDSYLITGYSEFEVDTAKIYAAGGRPVWKKHELIVDFMPSAIDSSAIDNTSGTKIMNYGALSDFLKPAAYSEVATALDEYCRDCEIKVTKIFDGQRTTDTLTVSRLGENIVVPPFWTTLLLHFPNNITIEQAHSAFKTVPDIVTYSHPDYLAMMHSGPPPTDTMYYLQHSLHATGTGTNADINIGEAWDIVPSGGLPIVKGGVFDAGLRWQHNDLGYNGQFNSGKGQGWDFVDNDDLRYGLFTDTMGHGTAVYGLIGSKRNNVTGIAGICGGNDTIGNDGVSLFMLNAPWLPASVIAEAIFESSRGNYFKGYGYGIHFSNNSWGIDSTWKAWNDSAVSILSEAFHFANKAKVTVVASRGNRGVSNNLCPATLDSTWIISVGGSDSHGGLKTTSEEPWWSSNWGKGVDVIAPSIASLIKTLAAGGSAYTHLNATSIAAPHVSGVVGLLMSYMNHPTIENHYQNLAPEDCEYFIQRSATYLGSPGTTYDIYTGFGRLNAGKALKMVEKPYTHLYHFGTNTMTPHTFTKTVYSNSDTVYLTEKYTNYEFPKKIFKKGKYIVKTFKIDASVSHNFIYGTDSIIADWPRHSSSYVFDLFNGQKQLNLHERLTINSTNLNGASLSGFIYQVWDTTGNPEGWWPCDTSLQGLITKNLSLMEYSLLAKNKAVGISENNISSQNIQVYPNPSKDQQNLIIESEKEEYCLIELYDLMGRFIKTIFKGKVPSGKTSIENTLENLPNSMYIYKIKIGDKLLSKKVIRY